MTSYNEAIGNDSNTAKQVWIVQFSQKSAFVKLVTKIDGEGEEGITTRNSMNNREDNISDKNNCQSSGGVSKGKTSSTIGISKILNSN